MKKLICLIALANVVINSHAMTCNEARNNIIKTTSDIRVSHQDYNSLSINQQQALLNFDDVIIASHNYINSFNFYQAKCNHTTG